MQKNTITEAKTIQIPQECKEAWPYIKQAIKTQQPQTLKIHCTIPNYKNYPLLNNKIELVIKTNTRNPYSAYWPQSYNQDYQKIHKNKPIHTNTTTLTTPFSINPLAYAYKFAKQTQKSQTHQNIEQWKKWALKKTKTNTTYNHLINQGAQIATQALNKGNTIQNDPNYTKYIDHLTNQLQNLTQIAKGTIELNTTSKAVYYHELTHAFDPKANWIHTLIDYSTAPAHTWFTEPKHQKLYTIDPAELDAMINTTRAHLETQNTTKLMATRQEFITTYKTGKITPNLDRHLKELIQRFKQTDQKTYRKFMSKTLNMIDETLLTSE